MVSFNTILGQMTEMSQQKKKPRGTLYANFLFINQTTSLPTAFIVYLATSKS